MQTNEPYPKNNSTKENNANQNQTAQNYINECNTYNYKTIMHYPDDYINEQIKIILEIKQKNTGGWIDGNAYYICSDDSDGDGLYNNNEYYIIDTRINKSLKLLEKDVIKIYGVFTGIDEVKHVLGYSLEVPSIDMSYVELVSE